MHSGRTYSLRRDNMRTYTPRDVALLALKKLSNEDYWSNGYAHTKSTLPRACLYEEIKRAADAIAGIHTCESVQLRQKTVFVVHGALFNRVSRDEPAEDLMYWNDAYNRTHADILALYRTVKKAPVLCAPKFVT